MSEDVLLTGFVIGGFRSFYGEPQYVGPLSKVTLVCGHNNDGKSNVLLAAAKLLHPLSQNRAPAFEPFDRPRVESDRWGAGDYVTGVALPSADDPLQALVERIGVAAPRGSTLWHQLEGWLASPAVRGPGEADSLIWALADIAEGRTGFRPSVMQARALAEKMEPSLLVNLSRSLTNNSMGSAPENALQVMGKVLGTVKVPEVVLVPAVRAIQVADQEGSTETPSLDGKGLPGWLVALQSPSAASHREDRDRFERINQFVRDVLDRPDARIWVPHNSDDIYVGLNDRVLPLANLGTGISQTILLGTIATSFSGHLICLEEPEIHLHPVLLRRLMRYLREETENQYLISTHSAALLDDPRTTVIRTWFEDEVGTRLEVAVTPTQRAGVARHLGYRASDLMQANAVVWVEGPSDRMYLNSWIRSASNRELVEGIHYSVMFFGGRLMAHLSGSDIDGSDDAVADDFISLLRINRNMAILFDSDKRAATTTLNGTKERLVREFTQEGFSWVTAGREIENYIPPEVLAESVVAAHPKASAEWKPPRNLYASAVEGIPNPDKVRIAEEVLTRAPGLWDKLDLQDQVERLVAFIRDANEVVTAGTVIAAPGNSPM